MNDLGIYSKNKLTIEYGGISKDDLLKNLTASGVMLNEFAKIIFSSEHFKTSEEKQSTSIIETSIKELKFPKGATIPEIKERIKNYGLAECPLEIAPYLRMKFINQKEIKEDLNHIKTQAPPGSITIFSEPIIEDDNFPKGFYLRKIDEKLWLRGYKCSMDYVWHPNDKLILKVK